MMARTIVVAAVVLASAVCAAQNTVTMRSIDRGAQSSVDSAKQAVARTQTEWETLWRSHNFDQPAPAVDFNRDMVVAVFMGSRPTGGFSIEITSVTHDNGKNVVRYRETRPAPGRITAQVITSPFHIVAVPKQSGEVVFEQIQ